MSKILPKKAPWSSASRSSSSDSPQQQQQNQRQGDPKKEQSLHSVLSTPELRTDLLLLVVACIDCMRAVIVDTFDPEKTGYEAPESIEKEYEEEQLTEEERKEQAEKEHDHRVKELAAPKMQELRKAALEHFDEWKDRVMERVGRAVNEKVDHESDKPADGDPESDLGESEAKTKQSEEADQEPLLVKPENALNELYPLQETALTSLSKPKRALLLHALLLLLLSLERYPGESRLLLLQIARSLQLPFSLLSEDESKVAQGLLEAAKKQMNADEETKKKAEEGATARKWKVGLGAVAGAALIGITGGLAAPLLAAGVGTVMGGLGLGTTAAATYLGAMAGSAPLIGVLFGAYGGRMTSKAVEQYAKEISDFAFLPLRSPSLLNKLGKSDKDNRRLRVAIGISGYLHHENDVTRPWQVISPSIEAFALRWELDALISLGGALTSYIKSAAWAVARREIIRMTVFAALTAGLWPLALTQANRIIDNPFSVARTRAEKAGEVLADALINKVQGERPVTLVGYSLGSRVVYSCLCSLADRHAFGLVEQAILMGSPTPSDSIVWRKMRSVVSGRLINVYSSNDYLLGYLYRTSSLQYGIAGLQRVKDVEGVENLDVSALVQGHTKYRLLTGRILKKVGFEDLDLAEVEKEDAELKIEDQAEEKERTEKERNAKIVDGEVIFDQAEQDAITEDGRDVKDAEHTEGQSRSTAIREVSSSLRASSSSELPERKPVLPQRPT